MGGAAPGRFPPAMRIAAVIQAALIAAMAAVILARAGVWLPGWWQMADWPVWVVVGLTTLSLVLNLITPSAGERAIWAPVLSLLVICSLAVALLGGPAIAIR
jgi:hypothetical protein